MSHTAKLVYHPDPQSTEEFILMVDPTMLKKWRDDPAIPLIEVVAFFDIFCSMQGSQGLLNKASKQQLENIFGESERENGDPDDIHFAKQMLVHGSLKEQHVEYNKGATVKNATRSNNVVDTRGGRNTSGV